MAKYFDLLKRKLVNYVSCYFGTPNWYLINSTPFAQLHELTFLTRTYIL